MTDHQQTEQSTNEAAREAARDIESNGATIQYKPGQDCCDGTNDYTHTFTASVDPEYASARIQQAIDAETHQLQQQRGELEVAIEQLIAIGRSLSHACYNVSQGDPRASDSDQQQKLRLLVEDWDDQVHAARQTLANTRPAD